MKTAKKLSKSDLPKNINKRILERCRNINGCLVWSGATSKPNGKGYGRIVAREGFTVCTHRAMYAANIGHIPAGKIICHICDNPLCCNTSHMFIGTQKENMTDMKSKGRGFKNPDKGEDSVLSKITDKDVRYIRNKYIPYDKEYGNTAMANKFNLSSAQISRIIKKTRWAHIK